MTVSSGTGVIVTEPLVVFIFPSTGVSSDRETSPDVASRENEETDSESIVTSPDEDERSIVSAEKDESDTFPDVVDISAVSPASRDDDVIFPLTEETESEEASPEREMFPLVELTDVFPVLMLSAVRFPEVRENSALSHSTLSTSTFPDETESSAFLHDREDRRISPVMDKMDTSLSVIISPDCIAPDIVWSSRLLPWNAFRLMLPSVAITESESPRGISTESGFLQFLRVNLYPLSQNST